MLDVGVHFIHEFFDFFFSELHRLLTRLQLLLFGLQLLVLHLHLLLPELLQVVQVLFWARFELGRLLQGVRLRSLILLSELLVQLGHFLLS